MRKINLNTVFFETDEVVHYNVSFLSFIDRQKRINIKQFFIISLGI